MLGEFGPKNLSQENDLRFERVNESTFKLTGGESTNVPASHGQSGGYRATKASCLGHQAEKAPHIPMEAGSRRTRIENYATLQRIIIDDWSRSLACHW